MTRTAAEIFKDARRLPPSELNWLTGESLQEGEGSSDAEIEASWKDEIERRVAEIKAGTAVTYSLEEVDAELRALLGK